MVHKSSNQIVRSPPNAPPTAVLARPKTGTKHPSDRPLGIDGGIVRHFSATDAPQTYKNKANEPKHREKRRVLYALSRTAASLLYPDGTPRSDIKGVGTCRWAVVSKANGVDVILSEYEGSADKRASYAGLQTCALVWKCPACADRISETRRRQLNDGLAWAKAQGHKVAMITLTARHGAGDDLSDLLQAMKQSKRRLHRHRRWAEIKQDLVAVITATEVTHGKNGWHPHFHMLVIVKTKEAYESLNNLGDAWRGALLAENLSGEAAAFHCQGASAAGKYIAKWGAAEELTLSGKKLAKGKGGKSPLQLLEAHKAGNPKVGQLWLEYAEAFYRRTQLDGLKKLVDLAGLADVSDEDAAVDQMQEDQIRDEPITNIDYDTWRHSAKYVRTDILDAAEINGSAGVWAVIGGNSVRRDIARPPQPKKNGMIAQLLRSIKAPP